MEPRNFAERFVGAIEKSTGAGSAPQQGELVAKPLMQVVLDNCEGSYTKAMEMMEKQFAPITKSLGTVDIGALRMVSLSDRVVVQRIEETRFHDFVEATGGASPAINDYQFRIMERNILNNYSSPFNMDNTSLPANQQSGYATRYNTSTAIGDTIKVSYLAQNFVSNQNVGNSGNLFEQQVDDEMVRIKKQINKMLLSNVEVVAENAGQVPQMHGFITASTVAPIACGGSNFTNALLQQGVDQLAALYGYGQLALFCGKGQLSVIRDLMINRFPGENSATYRDTLATLWAATQASAKGLQTNVVYQTYPGADSALPVYYDLDMPANTAILFKAGWPRIARMKFDGGAGGPYILARPEPTLFDLALVFDLVTLDDPQANSRVVYNNLAS